MFIAKSQQMDNQMQENRLLYYPTSEQWSQQPNPPTETAYQPTAERQWTTQTRKGKTNRSGQTNYQQDKIKFPNTSTNNQRLYAPSLRAYTVERSPSAKPSAPYTNLNNSTARPYAKTANRYTIKRTPSVEPAGLATHRPPTPPSNVTQTPNNNDTDETSGKQNE